MLTSDCLDSRSDILDRSDAQPRAQGEKGEKGQKGDVDRRELDRIVERRLDKTLQEARKLADQQLSTQKKLNEQRYELEKKSKDDAGANTNLTVVT